MLQIKDLTIIHKKDLHVMLQDFSCVLNKGDKAVIIGEEGDGKSTLLKWIYAPKLIECYADGNGKLMVSGERLGYLPQELPQREKQKSVYEFFMEEPAFFDLNPKELGKYASQFHVPAEFFYHEQKMETLSGGEKVKAQMIRLLLSQPTVLLLDEPSNDIDIDTLKWLEDLIVNWPNIVLFISHDEVLIGNAANTVIHIEQIRKKTIPRYTVARLSYPEYKRERLNQFKNQKQSAISDKKEKKLRDEKLQKIQQKVEHQQNTISRQDPHGGQLLKKKMHAVKSMEHRFNREDQSIRQMPEEEGAIYFKLGSEQSVIMKGKTVIDYSLDKLYAADNSRILSTDIALKIKGPEKICIVGANGTGKTTLLRQLAEELFSRDDIHAEYMPQDYEERLNLDMTPVDYLDSSGKKEERTRIRTFLGSLKFTIDEMEHPTAELSGGQKAKVFLLKMSLSRANVLILDEPTRNFSPLSGPVIRKMLADFPGAIISVSHDRKYITEICDTVYELTEKGLSLCQAFKD